MGRPKRSQSYAGAVLRQNISEFVETYYLANGVPPTIDEIATSLGTRSKSTIYYHLQVLVREGKMSVTRSGATARFIPTSCKVVRVEVHDW